ncbi:carboxylesterase/lipase family protein [Microbacterium sp. MPKO10]|uniref:carboxylesterase/lipase family protein n=1 Tax=Microbacterium sp. MPKO10 TaxID=2989818 RepID=UPI002236B707|nr:carboxylesterase family protein [Microbacterium sp. MPKO10]MCW4459168.1 carboxylesterase family protein [Microbacterium sp. MPKO10]
MTSTPSTADPDTPERDGSTVVQTTAGAVRGTQLGPHQVAFLGIPYAEAPTGERRFGLPVPHEPWEGVRDTTRYGATPLRDYMTGITLIPEPSYPGDETLTVNVFTPDTTPDAAMPVLVWIHGGGFTSGSPSSPWYETGSFPRDGVVVVSVSYRLGLDGFGVIDGAPGNRAVHDWMLALEWVRDNIAAFGGDPERVTIGGQSAGGTAVLTLLATPRAQPLFARAIAESPGASTGDRAEVAVNTSQVATQLGIAATRDALAAVPERDVFDAQQTVQKNSMTLTKVRQLMNGASSMPWTPVVDGDLIPYTLADAFDRGIGADKPLLIGANATETTALLLDAPGALDLLPPTLALRLAGLGRNVQDYRRLTPGRTRWVLGSAMTDAVFRFTVARALASKMGEVYAYDFRLPSALPHHLTGHCMELPFVWDCLDGENVEASTGKNPPQGVADEMHAAWVRFISTGSAPWSAFDPDGERWGQRYDRTSRAEQVFDRELTLVALDTVSKHPDHRGAATA